MSYATQTDLEDRYSDEFREVAEDSNNEGQIDVIRVARALGDAVAEVNSYISERYCTDIIEPYDPILVKLTGDIAMYNLPEDHIARSEHQRKRYEDAVALLKRISTGMASLKVVCADPQDDDVGQSEEPEITSEERLFTRRSMSKVT